MFLFQWNNTSFAMWIKKKMCQMRYISSFWFVVLSTLFPYQPVWDVTCTQCLKIKTLDTKWRNYRSSQPNTNFSFSIAVLRLMYDVSTGPLNQNRTKSLSWNPSAQHVLSIWTLPVPHGPPPQLLSAAALP